MCYTRGFRNAAITKELLTNNWDEISYDFIETTEVKQEELIYDFNDVTEELGEILFSDDLEGFVNKGKGLNDEEQKAFIVAFKESKFLSTERLNVPGDFGWHGHAL